MYVIGDGMWKPFCIFVYILLPAFFLFYVVHSHGICFQIWLTASIAVHNFSAAYAHVF